MASAALSAAVTAALAAICATDEGVLDSVSDDDRPGDGEDERSFGAPRDWLQFCQRVAEGSATPSCVIDFPYADSGRLNLQGDARLLERMYCFHDPSDTDPSCRLVVLHVHTLLPWGDRKKWTAASRLQVATSVNARHATRVAAGGAWVQERCKFHVVPKSRNLPAWQTLYSSPRRSEIVWRPHTVGSVPPGDPGVDWMYEKIREVIQAGDTLCSHAQLTKNLYETQMAMRGGGEVEYEIMGVSASVGVEDEKVLTETEVAEAGGEKVECEMVGVSAGFGVEGEKAETETKVADRKKVVGTSDPATIVDWKAEPAWHDLPAPQSPPARVCILFVGANNKDEAKLSLEREVETMRDAFTAVWGGDAWWHVVKLKHCLFADMQHLIKGLLDFKSVMVHFSSFGHQSALSLYQDPVSV